MASPQQGFPSTAHRSAIKLMAASTTHQCHSTPGQLLQKLTRIPVEVTNCHVEVRILLGWCGGEYVAHIYMHAMMEVHRMLIESTKEECHYAHPNGTIDVEIPPYGNIRRIRVQLQLEGGAVDTSFQPVGFSRPDSNCEGGDLTPPPNIRHQLSILTTQLSSS